MVEISRTTCSLRVVGRRLAPLCIALLLGGCDPYLGTTAASVLRKTGDTDPNIRYFAYDKLASNSIYDDDKQKTRAATSWPRPILPKVKSRTRRAR